MGLKNLYLIFDHPQRIYFGGQTVSGRVLVQIDEPKKLRSEYDDQTIQKKIVILLFLTTLKFVFTYLQYTGCPRRNVPNFGRVFLMLNYTDINQNTYIQS